MPFSYFCLGHVCFCLIHLRRGHDGLASFLCCCLCSEETSEYKGLDPKRRLLILKALCEIRADVIYSTFLLNVTSFGFCLMAEKNDSFGLQQDDTVAYIKDSLKQGTQISSFRKEKIGGDGNGTSFW